MKEERGKRERGMEREGERKREEEGGEGRENEVSDQDLASHTPLHIYIYKHIPGDTLASTSLSSLPLLLPALRLVCIPSSSSPSYNI